MKLTPLGFDANRFTRSSFFRTGSLLILAGCLSVSAFAQGSRGLRAAEASTVTIKALDPVLSERWPAPAAFLIKRNQTTAVETFQFRFSGSAAIQKDFYATDYKLLTFAVGESEKVVLITPESDTTPEDTETIRLFQVGGSAWAEMELSDLEGRVDPLEAVRFLTQASFGGDMESIQRVRQLGLDGWLEDQMNRPIGFHRPAIQNLATLGPIYHDATKKAMWQRVMRPESAMPDPVRQRVAYSLLQIFVVSQNVDALSLNSEGVASYTDVLLKHSFGNFRDIIRDVSLHPVMGVYLNHKGNRKGNPATNRFPDENYARELMQLFTIGLWMLNPDGSRVLVNGEPVPTYGNTEVSAYARVFTGYNWGGSANTSFGNSYTQNYVDPMNLWDSEHDLAPKTLLNGYTTPQRVRSNPDTGAAARADLEVAVDSLFYHQNVGPFIGRLLIQRLVTSNPSPGYISRVSAAFADNGQGVRGDMKAVIRAILMDPEARRYRDTAGPTWGKKREPYMTLFNMAKAFDARPSNGLFNTATYMYDFMNQEPYSSPSVFNFYSPNYRPSGAMTAQNLFAPEFQIMTAVTANGHANILYKFIHEYLATWGASAEDQIKLQVDSFLPLADDADLLVHRLADRLLDHRLSINTSRIIRRAVGQINPTGTTWRRDRINMALYLITSSPDFQIQR